MQVFFLLCETDGGNRPAANHLGRAVVRRGGSRHAENRPAFPSQQLFSAMNEKSDREPAIGVDVGQPLSQSSEMPLQSPGAVQPSVASSGERSVASESWNEDKLSADDWTMDSQPIESASVDHSAPQRGGNANSDNDIAGACLSPLFLELFRRRCVETDNIYASEKTKMIIQDAFKEAKRARAMTDASFDK